MLVVAIGQGAFQARGVGCPGTDRVPGADLEQQRIGVASATVHLYGEVELALTHPADEIGPGGAIRRTRVDPRPGRKDLDLGERRWPLGQQLRVQRRTQQHQLSIRVRVGQRRRGR